MRAGAIQQAEMLLSHFPGILSAVTLLLCGVAAINPAIDLSKDADYLSQASPFFH